MLVKACHLTPQRNGYITHDKYIIVHLFINLVDTDFSNHLRKSKLVRIIGRFKKSRVSIQCSTGDGKLSLVRIIGNQGFKNWEVGEGGGGLPVQRLPIISRSDLY